MPLLPSGAYRLFAGGREAGTGFASQESEWLAAAGMPLALAHVDPRHPDAMGAVEDLATSTGGFLVGGLTGGGRRGAASGRRRHGVSERGRALAGCG